MEPLYNVYFAGELMPGQNSSTVRAALGRLFKANDATLDKLFSGKTQLLKRDCAEATALKYQQAMAKAGAQAIVKISNSEAAPSANTEAPLSAAEKIAAVAATADSGDHNNTQQHNAPPKADTSADIFDLADAGTDVLKPEERAEVVEVNIDTHGLDIDDTARRLSEEPPRSPPPPDTSHLSMGEVGEDIPVLDCSVVPLNPNTDALALSPEGTDFSDCQAPAPTPPEVDLTGIALAPAGSDVLESKYRHKETSTAPKTDHITLEN